MLYLNNLYHRDYGEVAGLYRREMLEEIDLFDESF